VGEVDELKRALEHEYPPLDDSTADWDEVVRRASTRPPRRRGRAMILASTIANASAAAPATTISANRNSRDSSALSRNRSISRSATRWLTTRIS